MNEDLREKKLETLAQQLEGLTAYTESLWQFLPVAVCNLSPQGFILEVNPIFEKLSLWSRTKIVGKYLGDILPKDDASEIIKTTLKKKALENYETILLTNKGKKIDVAVYSHPRKNKEGDIIGFFLALIDIRKSKKFREELELQVVERTKELQEKIEELEKMNRLAVGRELKMIELKEEIKQLKNQLEDKIKK